MPRKAVLGAAGVQVGVLLQGPPPITSTAHQKLIFGQEFMLHRHRVNGMWVACGPRDLGHEIATDRDDRTPQRAQWWRRRRSAARCVDAAYAAAYAHW